MDRHPYLRRTKRSLELCYSPNVDGDGPGWVMWVGSLESDTMHWRGGAGIIHTALCGNIRPS